MKESFPRKVAGHRIEGEVLEFPHICPGEHCAIAEWLAFQQEKRIYGSLKPSVWQRIAAENQRHAKH